MGGSLLSCHRGDVGHSSAEQTLLLLPATALWTALDCDAQGLALLRKLRHVGRPGWLCWASADQCRVWWWWRRHLHSRWGRPQGLCLRPTLLLLLLGSDVGSGGDARILLLLEQCLLALENLPLPVGHRRFIGARATGLRLAVLLLWRWLLWVGRHLEPLGSLSTLLWRWRQKRSRLRLAHNACGSLTACRLFWRRRGRHLDSRRACDFRCHE
mmetsp:Transcript_38386/g.95789  ORF Transcript_38386/g.95789 Transcript_38386/m.95789 type:complete len:213 (+) Transcript_38386:166-804(+)